METKYSPINIDVIRSDCPLNFDLYIRVNEKFILYIRKNDGIEEDRLEKLKQILKLKEKDVDRLFTTEEGQEKFINYVEESVEKIVEDPKMPKDEQAEAILEIVQNAVEVVYADPMSVQAYQMAEKAAKGLRKLVKENPVVLKNIFNQKKGRNTDSIEAHCRNTAALAVKIAFSMGFRGDDLDNLGAAALIHDIGHVNLKKEEQEILFKRPISRFSPDDKRQYQPHVQHGVQMISSKPFVNEKIINLVAKHEEKLGGNGYPNKVGNLELLEQVLSFSNNFDKRINVQKQTPSQAFKEIQMEEMGNYDLKLFQKLRELLMAEDIFNSAGEGA